MTCNCIGPPGNCPCMQKNAYTGLPYPLYPLNPLYPLTVYPVYVAPVVYQPVYATPPASIPMPCDMYKGATSGDFAQADIDKAKKHIKKLEDQCDSLTRMLCLTLKHMEEIAYLQSFNFPPELMQWYEEHKQWDKSQGRS